MVYEDKTIIELERSFRFADICARVRSLYKTTGDPIYLRSLVFYTWYYAIEGLRLSGGRTPMEQEITFDQCRGQLAEAIAIAQETPNPDPSFLFLLGYVLSVHFDFFRFPEHLAERFLKQASTQTEHLEIANLCDAMRLRNLGFWLEQDEAAEICKRFFFGKTDASSYMREIISGLVASPCQKHRILFLRPFKKAIDSWSIDLRRSVRPVFRGAKSEYRSRKRGAESYLKLWYKDHIVLFTKKTSIDISIDGTFVGDYIPMAMNAKKRIAILLSRLTLTAYDLRRIAVIVMDYLPPDPAIRELS